MTSQFGITGATVIADAGSPAPDAIGFANVTTMTTHVETFLIPAAESLILGFLRRLTNGTYTSNTVPEAVRYTAIRVASAALIKIGVRKMGALITVQQWKVEVATEQIFNKDLQAELEPFRLPVYHAGATSYKTDEMLQEWSNP